MATFNHLKNDESQNKIQAVAVGLHYVTGHVIQSFVTGASPNHQITLLQALGDGGTHGWNKPRGVYYAGFAIKPENYHFHPGRLANSMADGDMAVDSWFPLDVPHSGTVTIAVQVPVGVGDADAKTNPPDKLAGIFETMVLPDFDSSGNLTGWSYTANPARCLVGLMLLYGALLISGVPDFYKYELAQNFLSKINWLVWTQWRDYCAALETVDYRTIVGDKGCGLTVSFYNGENFDTFVSKRIEPTVDISSNTGSPGIGVNQNGFSARFEGFVKAPLSGDYVFGLYHDDGGRVDFNGSRIIDKWVLSDGMTRDDSAAQTLVENSFYAIKIEWYNQAATGSANPSSLRLFWKKPGDATFDVVPVEVLFPLPEQKTRYESHVFFDAPTSVEDMIDAILLVSNSLSQDVDGKIEFYTIEQIAARGATFAFVENGNIAEEGDDDDRKSTLKLTTNDGWAREVANSLQGKIRDLDSQNLEEPVSAVTVELLDFQARAGRKIQGNSGNYFNMTRWQLRKVLNRVAARVRGGLRAVQFVGTAETYPVVVNDLVTVTSATFGWTNKLFEVVEASDSADDVESRRFILEPKM